MQLTLFGFADHPVMDEIKKLEIDKMSPMEATKLPAVRQIAFAELTLNCFAVAKPLPLRIIIYHDSRRLTFKCRTSTCQAPVNDPSIRRTVSLRPFVPLLH